MAHCNKFPIAGRGSWPMFLSMTTFPPDPQSSQERMMALEEVQFRLSLLRLTGQHAESLENLLTSVQAA